MCVCVKAKRSRYAILNGNPFLNTFDGVGCLMQIEIVKQIIIARFIRVSSDHNPIHNNHVLYTYFMCSSFTPPEESTCRPRWLRVKSTFSMCVKSADCESVRTTSIRMCAGQDNAIKLGEQNQFEYIRRAMTPLRLC